MGRIRLMEEEAKKSEQTLADTVTRLANKSKEADSVLKKAKVFESKCMNNEVTRKLGVQEDELRRALERAELAENKLKSIEEELQIVGENMSWRSLPRRPWRGRKS